MATMPVPIQQVKRYRNCNKFYLPDVEEIFANAKGPPDLAIRMVLVGFSISHGSKKFS
jgi:hypothetical protein